MNKDLEREALYEKRIEVACNLLGITKDFAYELQTEMCDSVTSAVIRLAHKKNPDVGLDRYYKFSLDVNKKCTRECQAYHIVDGIFDVTLYEDTKIPRSKYGWDRKCIDSKIMTEDELLKMMNELHYTLDSIDED